MREAESLSSLREFGTVTEEVLKAEVEELPIQPTIVGQETMLRRAWNRLMEDKVGIVGLYGMGGVGKTTLLTQINNKFSETGCGFDIVIWVVVSKNTKVHKIQWSIAKKLGLKGKEWDEKNENDRALDIHKVLRRKKYVLLLDDIWEKVDLNAIGVPYPNRENRCNVAFTTPLEMCVGAWGLMTRFKSVVWTPIKPGSCSKKKSGKTHWVATQTFPILQKTFWKMPWPTIGT